VLAYEGKLGPDDRDQIRDHLCKVFEALDRLFDEGITKLIANDDDEAGNFRIYTDFRIYSDGTPVFSVRRPTRQFPDGERYCKVFGVVDHLFDGGYDQPAIANDDDEAGGASYCGDVIPVDLEPGAEVIVAEPPHLRFYPV
jgi:hypothetical protein